MSEASARYGGIAQPSCPSSATKTSAGVAAMQASAPGRNPGEAPRKVEALGGKERADGEVVGDGRRGFRPCGDGEEEGDGDEREAWHGASEGGDCWF